MTCQSVDTAHGWLGFDCNQVLSAAQAKVMAAKGYKFAIRYVGRSADHPGDLTAAELTTLTAAGLGVMPVQHVASESSWRPTAALGAEYGAHAAATLLAMGLAAGTTCWLDLEGVDKAAPTQDAIDYCNAWFDAVAPHFQPGIYVGWHCDINPTDLRRKLKFTLYWAAYNLDDEQEPIECGCCMRQHVATHDDIPTGIALVIDTDIIFGDRLGRFPKVHAAA